MPENDPNIIKAVDNYLKTHDLALPDDVVYEPIIDGVFICIEDNPVLVVGLPPVSNYPVRETEHTDKYLRTPKTAAT